MARALHIVSSVGDVTDPRTWSGTPRGIWQALAKRRPGLVTHNILISYDEQAILGWINAALGLTRVEPSGIGPGRCISRIRAEQIMRRTGPADFLHFGSSHLPVKRRPGQRHYLFTDGAFQLSTYAPNYIATTNERHRRIMREQEREMVRALDGIFVTADYVAQSFLSDGGARPDQVVQVNSGLGHALPDPVAKTYDGGYMLFVAKQNFLGKGGPLLLDAFDIVRRTRPDATLVVIGSVQDPMQEPYMARMRETPGITFHNFDTPDYRALVAGAALYAGPAPDEPWGIVYLESLSVRTPIAGLARRAFPQFVAGGAHGFTATDDTPEAVAAMLIDALSDPARLERMGRAGRAHVLAEYSWDRVAERIVDHMDEQGGAG